MENKINYLVEKYGKKIRRNDLCPCGSEKKYKFCCYEKDKQAEDKKGLKLTEELKKENARRRAESYKKRMEFYEAFKKNSKKNKGE